MFGQNLDSQDELLECTDCKKQVIKADWSVGIEIFEHKASKKWYCKDCYKVIDYVAIPRLDVCEINL